MSDRTLRVYGDLSPRERLARRAKHGAARQRAIARLTASLTPVEVSPSHLVRQSRPPFAWLRINWSGPWTVPHYRRLTPHHHR